LDYITEKAAEKGLYIIMNPSPFDEAVTPAVLERVSLFILNEIEGGQITGLTGPEGILAEMQRRFPDAGCALTLGKSGVLYGRGGELHRHGAYDVEAVDTTAAGDTFTGYFAGCLSRGYPPGEALRIASAASALAVSKMGAGSSVPMWDEVVSADLRLLPEK
jgi:ribokinase